MSFASCAAANKAVWLAYLDGTTGTWTAVTGVAVSTPSGLMSTLGGEPLVLSGTNLGNEPASRHTVSLASATRSLLATGCHITGPHVTLTCFTPEAAGAGYTVTVTVAGQNASSALQISYGLVWRFPLSSAVFFLLPRFLIFLALALSLFRSVALALS